MTPVESNAVELELVRRAQAGDAEAFGQLVEHHRQAVYRAAYAALGSTEGADDVAQETFIAAYRKLSGFRSDASFRTWLLSIAWRKAIDRRRSVLRWLRMTTPRSPYDEDGPELMEQLADVRETQEAGLAADELRRAVKRLIGTLPRKLRDALLLAGAGDYSYEQIGRMLHVPVGTVKWRVSEARRLLRTKLAAMGYTHE
jgi:RNA polymerase sigma-70 factor, ECF subfamily